MGSEVSSRTKFLHIRTTLETTYSHYPDVKRVHVSSKYLDDLQSRLAESESRAATYREVLEFYADDRNWRSGRMQDEEPIMDASGDIIEYQPSGDRGYRARAALGEDGE